MVAIISENSSASIWTRMPVAPTCVAPFALNDYKCDYVSWG